MSSRKPRCEREAFEAVLDSIEQMLIRRADYCEAYNGLSAAPIYRFAAEYVAQMLPDGCGVEIVEQINAGETVVARANPANAVPECAQEPVSPAPTRWCPICETYSECWRTRPGEWKSKPPASAAPPSAPHASTAEPLAAPSHEDAGQGEHGGAEPAPASEERERSDDTPETDAITNAFSARVAELSQSKVTLETVETLVLPLVESLAGKSRSLEHRLREAERERDEKDRKLAECYERMNKAELERDEARKALSDARVREKP